MTKPESLGLSSERLARIAPFLEERYIKPGKLPCAQVQSTVSAQAGAGRI